MDDLFSEVLGEIRIKEDYDSEELDKWLNESIIDPIHQELSKEVWEKDGKIKKKFRKFILDKLYYWLDSISVKTKPDKVVILGSITTYQYNETSDIDVNVVIDVDKDTRKKMLKTLPNGTNLPGTKHPVNYYISADAESNIKKHPSAYDLLNDKWLKKIKFKKYNIPYSYIVEIAKFFMDGIDERISEYLKDSKEISLYKNYLKEKDLVIDKDEIINQINQKRTEVLADLDSLYIALKLVKGFRNKAFEDDYEQDFLISIRTKNPDYSVNNMVYKVLEKFGYIDKLHKYKLIREEYKNK